MQGFAGLCYALQCSELLCFAGLCRALQGFAGLCTTLVCFALLRFAICGVPINCALPVARRRPCIGPDAPRHCSAVGRGRRPGATGRPVRRDGSEPLGSLAAAGLQLTTGACYLGRPGLPVAPGHARRGTWACQRLRAIMVHRPAGGAGPSPAPSCAAVARSLQGSTAWSSAISRSQRKKCAWQP